MTTQNQSLNAEYSLPPEVESPITLPTISVATFQYNIPSSSPMVNKAGPMGGQALTIDTVMSPNASDKLT
ncbi:hypothetical protein PCANC_02079 [Puccinia coronata f. sp. avenae]|uniref:Uncharacterized protein n=1 Tax=Puccinia coronata f. sp. avenae TaxID=200324 RepID=A0A2N5VZU6_9BASI|nr:hypothetical protein PCANC_02079 [Puccinia coronata f. sp. avenae]